MSKSGKWEPEEDKLLQDAVDKYGARTWRKIAEFVPGRTSIQ
jgi:myb proto-oncogene protein